MKINACVASGGWVSMGQGAATAISPQGARTPTGLPTPNLATSPEQRWQQHQQEWQKTIGLDWQDYNSARASCFFVHFFAITARLWHENAYT